MPLHILPVHEGKQQERDNGGASRPQHYDHQGTDHIAHLEVLGEVSLRRIEGYPKVTCQPKQSCPRINPLPVTISTEPTNCPIAIRLMHTPAAIRPHPQLMFKMLCSSRQFWQMCMASARKLDTISILARVESSIFTTRLWYTWNIIGSMLTILINLTNFCSSNNLIFDSRIFD